MNFDVLDLPNYVPSKCSVCLFLKKEYCFRMYCANTASLKKEKIKKKKRYQFGTESARNS